MSEESEIQAEVEALRERFSDTKALYREVCALLFFRYGITPTASKLYQHVRKGSMSAPAEALAKFWEVLRGKARVEIDHPDLPEALKEAAGQAVSMLWTQATELAREELAVLRVEAHTEAQSAQAGLQEVQQRNTALEDNILAAQSKVAEQESRIQSLATELEQERRAHPHGQGHQVDHAGAVRGQQGGPCGPAFGRVHGGPPVQNQWRRPMARPLTAPLAGTVRPSATASDDRAARPLKPSPWSLMRPRRVYTVVRREKL